MNPLIYRGNVAKSMGASGRIPSFFPIMARKKPDIAARLFYLLSAKYLQIILAIYHPRL
jgi:hypothetical protein